MNQYSAIVLSLSLFTYTHIHATLFLRFCPPVCLSVCLSLRASMKQTPLRGTEERLLSFERLHFNECNNPQDLSTIADIVCEQSVYIVCQQLNNIRGLRLVYIVECRHDPRTIVCQCGSAFSIVVSYRIVCTTLKLCI